MSAADELGPTVLEALGNLVKAGGLGGDIEVKPAIIVKLRLGGVAVMCPAELSAGC